MRHVLASTMLALSSALAACGGGDGPTALHTRVDCTASVTASTGRVMQGQNTGLSITFKGVLDARLNSDNDTQYVVPKSVYRGSANDSFDIQVSPTQSTLYTLRATCANNTTTTPSAALVDVVVPGTVVPEQPTVVGVLGQKVTLKFKFTNVQGCVAFMTPGTNIVAGAEGFAKLANTMDMSYREDSYGTITWTAGNTKTVGGKVQVGYECDDVNVANQKVRGFVTINEVEPPLTKVDSASTLSISKMANGGALFRVYLATPSCVTDNTVDFHGTRVGFGPNPENMGQAGCETPSVILITVWGENTRYDTVYVQQPNGPLLTAPVRMVP